MWKKEKGENLLGFLHRLPQMQSAFHRHFSVQLNCEVYSRLLFDIVYPQQCPHISVS